MNIKNILKIVNVMFLFLLANQCLSFIADDEFIRLCATNGNNQTLQEKSSLIIRAKLNSGNQLKVLQWLSTKICDSYYPIEYAITKQNFFIANELINYISFDRNKLQPFNYLSGSISNNKNIANKIYDEYFLAFYLPYFCYLGNKKIVTLICDFYNTLISEEIILKSIARANSNNNIEIVQFLADFLTEMSHKKKLYLI